MPTDFDSQEVRANVDALVRYAQASADENRTLRKKLDKARNMFAAIIRTNGEFAIKQAHVGLAWIDAKQKHAELEPTEQETQNAD